MARPKGFLFSPSPAQGETEDVYFSSQERARCKIHPMFLASLSQTQKGQSRASRPAVSPSGVGTAQFQLARPYSKLWRQLNKIIGVSRPNIAASFNKLLEHYYEWPHPPLLWTFHPPAVWQKVLEYATTMLPQQLLPWGGQNAHHTAASQHTPGGFDKLD